MKTKPNKFESGEHLIELWRKFCNSIVENEFNTVPTQTAFCRWLEYDEEKAEDALSKALREEAERMQNGELSE